MIAARQFIVIILYDSHTFLYYYISPQRVNSTNSHRLITRPSSQTEQCSTSLLSYYNDLIEKSE